MDGYTNSVAPGRSKVAPLYDQLTLALGRATVVVEMPPGVDGCDPAELIFIMRGATLERLLGPARFDQLLDDISG